VRPRSRIWTRTTWIISRRLRSRSICGSPHTDQAQAVLPPGGTVVRSVMRTSVGSGLLMGTVSRRQRRSALRVPGTTSVRASPRRVPSSRCTSMVNRTPLVFFVHTSGKRLPHTATRPWTGIATRQVTSESGWAKRAVRNAARDGGWIQPTERVGRNRLRGGLRLKWRRLEARPLGPHVTPGQTHHLDRSGPAETMHDKQGKRGRRPRSIERGPQGW